MIARASAGGVLERTRIRIRQRIIHQQLLAATAGKSQRLTLDIDDSGVDVAGLVRRVASRLRSDSPEIKRLELAFRASGITEVIVDGLAARNGRRRANSARLVGDLRVEEAVPWIAPLLASREASVAEAAARALGKIGGLRSAEALLVAIQRAGPKRTLVVELARAAPDLFIETVLSAPQRPGVVPAAAVAAGLRRRHTATGPLLGLLTAGNRRQRVVSCRALGWIGATSAIPLIALALYDREWRVRMSAAKALVSLKARTARPNLEVLLADRHPRVSRTAALALRRMERP